MGLPALHQRGGNQLLQFVCLVEFRGLTNSLSWVAWLTAVRTRC